VTWTDSAGHLAAAASNAFSTALLQESDWNGSAWLSLQDNDTRNQFRGGFTLPPDGQV